METRNTKPLSSRLRQRLSEPAMLDLTQRLIAIPSENPPGNQYEECARVLSDELDRLGFAEVRREGACVLASVGTGLWTRIADRLPWTERVRSHPQHYPKRGDLRAYGGRNVALTHGASDEEVNLLSAVCVLRVHRSLFTGSPGHCFAIREARRRLSLAQSDPLMPSFLAFD